MEPWVPKKPAEILTEHRSVSAGKGLMTISITRLQTPGQRGVNRVLGVVLVGYAKVQLVKTKGMQRFTVLYRTCRSRGQLRRSKGGSMQPLQR